MKRFVNSCPPVSVDAVPLAFVFVSPLFRKFSLSSVIHSDPDRKCGLLGSLHWSDLTVVQGGLSFLQTTTRIPERYLSEAERAEMRIMR